MKVLRILFFAFVYAGLLAACAGAQSDVSTREYVLTTGFEGGNLVYLGVGGDINGMINPTLHVNPGETITVMLVNSGYGEHDVSIPELKIKTKRVTENGESVSVQFTVPEQEVELEYYDSVANHAEIGMVGILRVSKAAALTSAGGDSEILTSGDTDHSSNEIAAQAFKKGGCGACHVIPGIEGAVGIIGPDLTNIGDVAAERLQSGDYTGNKKTVEEYLNEALIDPNAFISPDCPSGPCQEGLMLSGTLDKSETQTVVSYLAGLSDSAVTVQTGESAVAESAVQAPTSLPVGDANRGELIYIGGQVFEKGGTPCIACHTVGALGSFGGGTLGPDLTHVYQRYGEAGLTAAIQNIAFPTMQGAYADKPLTNQEIADLLAFFKNVDAQGGDDAATEVTPLLWAAGILGTVVLFGVMAIFWLRQRESLSDRLRRDAGITSRRDS